MPRVHGIDTARRHRHVSFTDGAIHGNVGKSVILSNCSLPIESSANANAASEGGDAAAVASSLGKAAKSSWLSPSCQTVKDANEGNSNDAAHCRAVNARTRGNVLSDCSNCDSSTVAKTCSKNAAKVSSASKIVPLSKDDLDRIEFSSRSFSVPVLTSKDTVCHDSGGMTRLESGCIGIAPSLDHSVTVGEARRMTPQNCHDDNAQCHRDICHTTDVGNDKFHETTSIKKYNSSDTASSTDESVASKHTEITEPGSCEKALSDLPNDARETFSNRKQSCQINPHALWLYNRCSTALNAMQTEESPLDLGLKILDALDKNNIIDMAHQSQEDLPKLQHLLFASIGGGKRRDLNLVFDVCDRREVLRQPDMKKSLMEVAHMKEFQVDCTNDAVSRNGEERVCGAHWVNADVSATIPEKEAYVDGITNESASKTESTSKKIETNNSLFNGGSNETIDMNADVVEGDQTPVGRKSVIDLDSTHESASVCNSTEATSKENASPLSMINETDRAIKLETTSLSHEHKDMSLQNAPSASNKDAAIGIREDSPIQSHDCNAQQHAIFSSKKPRSRRKSRSTCCKVHVDLKPGSNDDSDMVTSKSMKGSSSRYVPPLKSNENDILPIELPMPNHEVEMHDDIEWSFAPSNAHVAQEDGVSSPSRRVTRSMGSVASTQSKERSKTTSEESKDQSADSSASHGFVYPRDNGGVDAYVAVPNQDHKSEASTEKETKYSARKSREYDVSSDHGEEDKGGESNGSLVTHCRSIRKRGDKREPVRVMFTGFNPTQLHKQMIRSIGAELVENVRDAATATHIIVSDGKTPLRRTPKLMICISKVSKILNIKWLEESFKQQQLLDTKDFLHVDDAEAEKRYSFSMRETIRNGISVRNERGGVLGGRWIYICRGVAGYQAPSTKELHLIIEAAGGTVLRSLSSPLSNDPVNTIILTSDPRTQSQLNENGIELQMTKGAKACTTSWLFHTIITQRFCGIDDHNNAKECEEVFSKNEGRHLSRLVRCESHESLVSTLSASPVRRCGRSASGQKRNVTIRGDASIFSSFSRGSMVSHLEYALPSSPSKLQRKESEANWAPKPASKHCNRFLSRDQFLSNFSHLSNPCSITVDRAAIQVGMLWTTYFNKVGEGETTPKVSKFTKGVRCRRGRKRTLSPLVTCTSTTPAPVISGATSPSEKKCCPTAAYQTSASKSTPENYDYLCWEAYVLFRMRDRAVTLESNRDTSQLRGNEARHTFPRPVTIDYSMKKLSLIVETDHGPAPIQESRHHEVFGTLQDVFDLHRRYQKSGHIPESVVAQLTILAIQAVSTMHACGVVHNDISLDSFLVVRAPPCENSQKTSRGHESHWHLQIIGFGYKSLVLNCQQLAIDHTSCDESRHFEQDYESLANVVHVLLTGGMSITLTEVFGRVDFISKAFLKGNLFLRGALSWCALLDALIGFDDDFDPKPLLLQYPFDVFEVEPSDEHVTCRKNQVSWACRMLHELSSSNMSLNTFLEGLRPYNPRFILPRISASTFACPCSNTHQSFALCPPVVENSMVLQSNLSNKDAHQLQVLVEKERKLKAESRLLARREANHHNTISEIYKKTEENRALYQSNLEIERIIRQKETELLRREEDILTKEAHIEEIKKELLTRERLIQRQMQQLTNTNQFECLQTYTQTFDSPQSPCHSIQAQSSVCFNEVDECGTSIGSSGGKRVKRRDLTSMLRQQNSKPNQSKCDNTPPTRRRNVRYSPVPRPSEHLCSLQNLGSPSTKSGRVSSDVDVNMKRKSNGSADDSLEPQKRTPKKVFINIGD